MTAKNKSQGDQVSTNLTKVGQDSYPPLGCRLPAGQPTIRPLPDHVHQLARPARTGFSILLVYALLSLAALSAGAAAHYQVLLDLYSANNGNDRNTPALLMGSDGVLYGTTDAGAYGTNAGSIFALNRDGTGYRLLHTFSWSDSGGAAPMIGLAEGADGALYGTTSWGGAFANPSAYGSGTIYKINKDGSQFHVLHDFSGAPDDGDGFAIPYGENALLIASDGHIYGTTSNGGENDAGTLYTLNLDGTGYAVLYSFGQPYDSSHDYGRSPVGGLIEGRDGAMYGVASYGGLGDSADGDGVVFKLLKDGSGYTILHNFSSDSGDLTLPLATLLEGSDGALYGTASTGGPPIGAAFSLSEQTAPAMPRCMCSPAQPALATHIV